MACCNKAKALWAKILVDEKMREEFSKAKNEEDFLKLAKAYGYDCTLEQFVAAKKEKMAEGTEVDAETLGQSAGGLSMVGVDYAFTAVELH